MNPNVLEVFEIRNRRYRTVAYGEEGRRGFCISEKTAKGTLLTEFNESGQVINQVYRKFSEPLTELKNYLGVELKVSSVQKYNGVVLKSSCKKCNGMELIRELDLLEPEMIKEVPVVSIFVCKSCGKRFYSITDAYLKKLVENNTYLFEKEELSKKNADESEFIKTLQEYIIRIYASKKIDRVAIEVGK